MAGHYPRGLWNLTCLPFHMSCITRSLHLRRISQQILVSCYKIMQYFGLHYLSCAMQFHRCVVVQQTSKWVGIHNLATYQLSCIPMNHTAKTVNYVVTIFYLHYLHVLTRCECGDAYINHHHQPPPPPPPHTHTHTHTMRMRYMSWKCISWQCHTLRQFPSQIGTHITNRDNNTLRRTIDDNDK